MQYPFAFHKARLHKLKIAFQTAFPFIRECTPILTCVERRMQIRSTDASGIVGFICSLIQYLLVSCHLVAFIFGEIIAFIMLVIAFHWKKAEKITDRRIGHALNRVSNSFIRHFLE